MAKETFLITVPPQQLRALQGWEVTPAHLAYRVGKGPHLFRTGGTTPLKGGVMVAVDEGYDGLGDVGPLAQEFVRECLARNFTGAVLDFDSRLPPLRQMAARLDESFARRGWTLYVPEAYGPATSQAKVMIPSALSGGSLEQRLEEAVERFGADRVTLALQKSSEDFFLPSPTGGGVPLSGKELSALMERLHPSVFFSAELCARYFTYMDKESGAHFVLFDDVDTMKRKMELARRAGISSFIAPWAEAEEYAAQLGLRKQTPPQGTRPRNQGQRN